MTKLGLEWSKGPNLLLPRDGHRSIVLGNQIYHIGGGDMIDMPFDVSYRVSSSSSSSEEYL